MRSNNKRFTHEPVAWSPSHATTARLKFGELGQVNTWCQQHCKSDYCYALGSKNDLTDQNDYIFYFKSKEDRVLFSLTWL